MGVARSRSLGLCQFCFGGLRRFLPVNDTKDVIVIVGPSGVGKSTLIKRLMHDYAGRFGFSVSHTTRQPRPGEKQGVHYNFTTRERIQNSIADGAFIEHAEVHGNIYGTSFEAVEKVVSSGRVCLLDIDVQGAKQLKQSSLNEAAAYIFIAPPSVEGLERRLRERNTETEEKILVRLCNAKMEVGFAKQSPSFFGKVLVNDDLDKAYSEFRRFMERSCGYQRLRDGDSAASPGLGLFGWRTPRSPWSPKTEE